MGSKTGFPPKQVSQKHIISHSQTLEANTTSFGLQSFRGLGPKIWALIPNELKNIQSLDVFKDKLKKIKFEQCPCNIWRVYVDEVGYID